MIVLAIGAAEAASGMVDFSIAGFLANRLLTCITCYSLHFQRGHLPQHIDRPAAESLLSTPGIGLSAISVTPVSV